MRQFTIGILCTTAFLAAAGCNKTSQNEGPAANLEVENATGNVTDTEKYFTVRAGPVAPAKIAALSGDFELQEVSKTVGIPSTGSGGACLVFSAADLGIAKIAGSTCNINSDCEDDGVAAYYCHAPSHSCWVRPKSDPKGDYTCNRPLVMSPGVVNHAPKTPVDAATKLGLKPGVRVRVVACLNQKGFVPPPNPNPTGCPSINGPDRIEVMGPEGKMKP